MLSAAELNQLALLKSSVSLAHEALPGWRSESDNGLYPETVRRLATDTNEFMSFKRNLVYRQILEHVTEEQGIRYLQELQKKWPAIILDIDKFKINDSIGDPFLVTYPATGAISPTTLRYLKVAADLRELFGDLSGFNVAEIGGGYGGQFLLADSLWELGSWTMFDLDPVILLIERYLECHLTNSFYRAVTLNRFDQRTAQFDLLVSNYAFSELPIPVQLKYISKVLSKATRGYMTMNSGKHQTPNAQSMSAAELQQHIPLLSIVEESPLTSEDNYIIVWGHNQQDQPTSILSSVIARRS